MESMKLAALKKLTINNDITININNSYNGITINMSGPSAGSSEIKQCHAAR
jgi:hypothetical protein